MFLVGRGVGAALALSYLQLYPGEVTSVVAIMGPLFSAASTFTNVSSFMLSFEPLRSLVASVYPSYQVDLSQEPGRLLHQRACFFTSTLSYMTLH